MRLPKQAVVNGIVNGLLVFAVMTVFLAWHALRAGDGTLGGDDTT